VADPVLRAQRLTKRYLDGRRSRVVLNEVDISVAAGDMVAVRGPSGCGKSTLLSILVGLVSPDSGLVEVHGVALDFRHPAQLAKVRQAHIGLVSQEYGLLEDETVHANVALPLRFVRPRLGRYDRQLLVERALELAHVDINPGRPVDDLSGGERQRVAIARGLVRSPSVLVADEPTAALDAARAKMIASRLRTIADGGVGILVATHDPAVAAFCDSVLQLEDGALRRLSDVSPL